MARLSITQAVEKLNKFLVSDPLAFTHLVELRVDCGPLHIANPSLSVHNSFYGRPLMGVVELLNNLFEDRLTMDVIRAGGKVKQFVLKPKKKPLEIQPTKFKIRSVCKPERRVHIEERYWLL